MSTCSSLLHNINMYGWELLDAGLRATLLPLLAVMCLLVGRLGRCRQRTCVCSRGGR